MNAKHEGTNEEKKGDCLTPTVVLMVIFFGCVYHTVRGIIEMAAQL